MATLTLKGKTIHSVGNLPEIGSKAKNFDLVSADMSRLTLDDFKGKRLLLNIFPSVDTGTCAMSVRKFNEMAGKMDNTTVLCVSKDLPFAFKRFCAGEGIENVMTASDFRTGEFGRAYGVTFSNDSLMEGLLTRAIVIINEDGDVIYTEQVAEIVDEPDYEKALEALKK